MVLLAAVEGGGTTWVAAIAKDHPENIIERAEWPTTSPAETLGLVRKWLDARKFDALGVATFGCIDPKLGSPTWGYITSTPKLDWRYTDVLGVIWDGKVPVQFDTDVNAPALAEYMYNAEPGDTSCVYITVGTGVGVGVVVNSKPVHGLVHPEGGHMKIAPLEGDTFPGVCPFHGNCVEGLASSVAVAKRKGCDRSELPNLSDDDEVWEHCAHALGSLCASLVCGLSPERIVISGGVLQRAALFPKIRKHFLKVLNEYIVHPKLTEENVGSFITPSKWGNTAGLIGALTLSRMALEGTQAPDTSSRARPLVPYLLAALGGAGIACVLLGLRKKA
jgi:fructokinase|uniref:fructokinase n=1 Tax=Eutreptiella gymnastica TaxID=73025 RepID=A0A7S4LHB7_9EUGL